MIEIAVFAIVIYLFFDSRSQLLDRKRIAALSAEIEELRSQIKTKATLAPQDAVQTELSDNAPFRPSNPAADSTPEAAPVAAIAEPAPSVATPPSAAPVGHPPKPSQSFEEWFAGKGLVWLGGVTIALGGIFLIKLGIDYGAFTPKLQIAAALTFAAALMGFGEWLRLRESSTLAGAAIGGIPVTLQNPNVRQALAGSGLFIAFAAIYGAHMLLGLIDARTAFAAFGGLTLLGLTMSVWHGIGVAFLGLAGGFLTPLLVKSDSPDATALFVYLSALVAAICVTAQRRSWRPLIYAALAGISAWTAAWTVGGALRSGEIAPPGLFLLFSLSACMLAAGTWIDKKSQSIGTDLMVSAATVCMTCLYVAIIGIGGDVATIPYAFAAVALLGVVAAVYERHAVLAVIAAIWSVGYVLLWPAKTLQASATGFTSDALVPVAGILGVAFGIGGFARLQTTSRPALWGKVSAYAAMAIFVAAAAIATFFRNDLSWSFAGFGLSAAAAAACGWCLQRRAISGYLDAAGAFSWASAVTAVTALLHALDGPQLTLSFAALLPVLAWTGVSWAISAHRRIAIAVAALVASRPFTGPGTWNALEQDHVLGPWWIAMGFLAPALLSFWAAREFLRERRDLAVEALEALSLLLALCFTAYAIRIVFSGSFSEPAIWLAEIATHILVWGFGALALERVAARTSSMVAKGGFWVLTSLFVAGVLWSLTPAVNPLFTPDSVGAMPVFNDLALLYLGPAILLLLISWRFQQSGAEPLSATFSVAGLGLIGFWLSLETRRAFQGPVLSARGFGDAEFYAYSVVWLLYSMALLILALRTKLAWLRWASLAVLSLTVAKVFGADMASLEGLWRVASFMGLGLSLVGIGALFQRFVFPRTGSAPSNNA